MQETEPGLIPEQEVSSAKTLPPGNMIQTPVFSHLLRGPNPSRLIQQFLTLRPDQQLHIFNTLKSHLVDKGMLGGSEDA